MRIKKQYGVLENVEIIDIADEGKAVGRYDEMVVFVIGAVPGDIVDVKVTKSKRNYIEGKAINFHKYSDDRTLVVVKRIS